MPRIQSVSIRLQKDWRGASERGIVELNKHAWVAPLFDLVIVEGKASHVNKRAKASQLRGNWSSLILFGSFVFRISLWWIWMIWYPVQAASCFDGATLMIKHVCGFKIMHRFSYFSDYHLLSLEFQKLDKKQIRHFYWAPRKSHTIVENRLSQGSLICRPGFKERRFLTPTHPSPAHLRLLSLVFLQTFFLITFKYKALGANRIDWSLVLV